MSNTIDLLSQKKVYSTIDLRLTLSTILLSVMVLVRDLGYVDIPHIAFISFVTLVCFTLPYKSLKPFAYFLLPFWFAIHGLGAFVVLLALFIKSGKWSIKQLLFTLIILFIELISFIACSFSFTVEINKYVVYAIMIAMFFYMLFDDTNEEENLRKCMKWYILGNVIIISIIIIHSISLFGFDVIVTGGMRIGGDNDVFTQGEEADTTKYAAMNANTLAYYSVTALALALIVKDIFKTQAGKWICIGLLLIAGLLTTSRTWLLVLAFVLLFYSIFSSIKGRIGLIIFTGILLLFAMHYIGYSKAFTSRFEDRMTSQDFETGGGRTTLFAAYNNFLINNPEYLILGTGAIYYKNVCKVWNSTHNGLQQILVCYGVFGILFFLICGLVFYRCYVWKRKIPFLYFVPFWACFLFDQSLQLLNPVSLMFPFLATVLPFKLMSCRK